MKPILGCDSHKRYSVFVELFEDGKVSQAVRVEHDREVFRAYLASLATESEIALESTGHWYWLVDEMERAGHHPHLGHPLEAKKRMGKTNKGDSLDAAGLAILQRNGTLPEVWIPPRELRDQRELLRTRMALLNLGTRLKQRIHAALERYGILYSGSADLFGTKGRDWLDSHIAGLPPHTAEMLREQLRALDEIIVHVKTVEQRIHEVLHPDPVVKLLQTIPGVGAVLGPVIALEIGDIRRFGHAGQLASYCGLVPRVFSSGGKTRHGHTSRCVNLYLRWAFVEAAVCATRFHTPLHRHVNDLYQKLKPSKGHGRAAVAIARHLAEAAFWMLTKNCPYRPPQRSRSTAAATVDPRCSSSPPSSTNGSARVAPGTR